MSPHRAGRTVHAVLSPGQFCFLGLAFLMSVLFMGSFESRQGLWCEYDGNTCIYFSDFYPCNLQYDEGTGECTTMEKCTRIPCQP